MFALRESLFPCVGCFGRDEGTAKFTIARCRELKAEHGKKGRKKLVTIAMVKVIFRVSAFEDTFRLSVMNSR